MASPDEHKELYDSVYDTLLGMPSEVVLARAEYGIDFVRYVCPGPRGNWEFREPKSELLYETILVGEIRPALCGTCFSAKGTHFIGPPANPSLIDDKTRVKSVLVLGKPMDATEELSILFENQIATLRNVIALDNEELLQMKRFLQIKEWTAHAGSDTRGIPDYICVITPSMYTTPKGGNDSGSRTSSPKKRTMVQRTVPRGACASSATAPPVLQKTILPSTTKQISSESKTVSSESVKEKKTDNSAKGKKRARTTDDTSSSNDLDVTMTDLTQDTAASVKTNAVNVIPKDNRSTNDVYHPSALCDYGGPLFQQQSAMLKQLDFRDINDDLIPPSEWYSALRQGTFVMVRATLHAYNFDSRRVYQVNAETIKVLRESSMEVEPHPQPVLQSTRPSATNTSSGAAKAFSMMKLGKRSHEDTV